MQNKNIYFFGFEPTKMYCKFTYTNNAFQDESWDLSNFICYEGSLMSALFWTAALSLFYLYIYLIFIIIDWFSQSPLPLGDIFPKTRVKFWL